MRIETVLNEFFYDRCGSFDHFAGRYLVGEILWESAPRFPEKIAVIFQGQKISYRELDGVGQAGGLDGAYATWNYRAATIAGVLFILFGYPILRGWGRVRVTVRAPQNGRALFSISISRRAKKFKDDKKESAAPAWRFEKRLQAARGSERRLKGNVMVFGFVGARRKPYYVTVRGPLLDLATDKLIGEFLEEKTLRVYPWRTNEVKFDMRTELAAITVKPNQTTR